MAVFSVQTTDRFVHIKETLNDLLPVIDHRTKTREKAVRGRFTASARRFNLCLGGFPTSVDLHEKPPGEVGRRKMQKLTADTDF